MAETKKKLALAISNSLGAASAASAASIQAIQPLAAAAMEIATDAAERAAEEVTQYASDHPYMTAAMATSAVLTIAPGLITAPALSMAGFGAEGVAAGSAAAGLHSTIGNVVAGSGFATLQSAGAGGVGLAAVNGIVQGASVGAAAAAAVARSLWARVRA